MQNLNDSPEYYRMREAHERQMAERAPTPEVRDIHLKLAEKYAELANAAAHTR